MLAALICTGESHGVLESRWLLHLDVRAEGLLEPCREDGDLLRFRDVLAASQEQEELLLVIVDCGGTAELCQLAKGLLCSRGPNLRLMPSTN